MSAINLNGITWGHSRGITPLLALSQRYAELHPGVNISWTTRSLQEFADYPIEKLTEDYDLLIIDHPWVGCAAATHCVLPLNEFLPAAYWLDQQENSVGGSHESYHYNHQQWAIAVDAAAPAASYRKDLLPQLPQNWADVLDLAKAGKVAVPAIPIDLLMNFYTFCIAHGQAPFEQADEIIPAAIGVRAIETMKELYSLVSRKMFACNPIAVAELMSATNDYAYCPFAYCYSNYSRRGYAPHLLHYTTPVFFNEHQLRTTIGGTGLAVSAFSKHQDIALDFAKMAGSSMIQQTLYVQHGGQPGHLKAWQDASANALTNNFFTQVLPVMENGYLRPRYNGYLHFQDHAGLPLQQCLMQDTDPQLALNAMNLLYQQSVNPQK